MQHALVHRPTNDMNWQESTGDYPLAHHNTGFIRVNRPSRGPLQKTGVVGREAGHENHGLAGLGGNPTLACAQIGYFRRKRAIRHGSTLWFHRVSHEHAGVLASWRSTGGTGRKGHAPEIAWLVNFNTAFS